MNRKGKNWTGALLLGALAVTGTTGVSIPARAADPPANAPARIGVVDESKVGASYARLQDTLKRYGDRGHALQPQLDAREMMTEAEGRRFDELIMKDAPSAAETTELGTLVTTGTGRRTAYQQLMGQANRTPADDARLRDLQTIGQNAVVGAQRIEDALLDKLKTAQDAEMSGLVDTIGGVIRQVAESRGLTIVVTKAAVVWSAATIDISDDVISKLNNGAAPPATAPPATPPAAPHR